MGQAYRWVRFATIAIGGDPWGVCMSFAHSGDATARIRILGCDPAPPARRRPPFRIAAGVLGVAVLGIAVALALPSARPQTPQIQAEPVLPLTTMGTVGSKVTYQTRQLHRAVRTAATADLPAAARLARRQQPAPVVLTGTTPAAGTSSSAPVGSPGTSSGGSSDSGASQPVVVGPELPPGPMNPGVSAP